MEPKKKKNILEILKIKIKSIIWLIILLYYYIYNREVFWQILIIIIPFIFVTIFSGTFVLGILLTLIDGRIKRFNEKGVLKEYIIHVSKPAFAIFI